MAFALSVLVMMHAYSSALWLKIDRRPPRVDESHYLAMSLHSYRELSAGQPIAALGLKGVSSTKSGMVQFLSALSYFAVGEDEHTAIFVVNELSNMLIAFGLLWSSRLMYDSLAPGLVAALWVQALNSTITWSGYYQIDLPLSAACTVTLALCLRLLKTGFNDKAAAVCLAVAIAVGSCIKHLYVAFAGPPVAIMLAVLLIRGNEALSVKIRARRVVIASVISGTALGAAYHVMNFHVIAEQFHRALVAPDQGAIAYAQSVFGLFWLLLPGYQTTHLWLFVAGCGCSALACGSLVLLPISLIAGGWIGVSYATQQPWSYYLFPVLPSFALVCGSVFVLPRFMPAGIRRYATAVSMIAVGALAIVFVGRHFERRLGTANPARLIRAVNILRPGASSNSNPLSDQNYWSSGVIDGNASLLPYPHDWKLDEIATTIGDITRRHRIPLRVALLARSEWMNDFNLAYKMYKHRLIEYPGAPFGTPVQDVKTPEDVLKMGDILVMKSPDAFSRVEQNNPWAAAAAHSFELALADDGALLRQHGFVRAATFPLPDHSNVTAWYRSTAPTLEDRQASVKAVSLLRTR